MIQKSLLTNTVFKQCHSLRKGTSRIIGPSTLSSRKINKLHHPLSLLHGKCYYSVYAWGTSTHGSIPMTSSSGNDQSTSSVLLNATNKTVYDHPKKIDLTPFLGESSYNTNPTDNETTNSEEVTVNEFKCGNNQSAILLSDGRCYTWGHNSDGQLGHGHNDTNISATPTLMELSTSTPFSSISLHTIFSAAISADSGDLYTFGSNGSALKGGMGFLGHGDEHSYYTPKLVESLAEDGCTTSQVCLGESHMVVLTTEGEVLTAGAGSYGRLGNLESVDQLFLEPVEMLEGETIRQISAGNAFSLALTNDGMIYAWGRNDKGQLGDGGGLMVDMYAMENLPVVIEKELEGRKVEKISTGYAHAACITDNGEVWFWGMSQYLEPTRIFSMLDKKCVDVECGQNYTLILTDEGELYTFGKGKTGVLGHANTSNLTQPALVEGLQGKKVMKMSAGFTHCAVIVDEK